MTRRERLAMRPGAGLCTGQDKQQPQQNLEPPPPLLPDLMMEATAATTSSLVLFSPTPRRSPTKLKTPPSLLRAPCNHSCSVSSAKRQHLVCLAVPWLNTKKKSSSLNLRCSSSLGDGQASTVGSSVRWVLDPAGDGDWRHIGYKVARPGAFEITSDVVTVGRVSDKADIVLPIATVSGTHARLEKKDGRLLVTDLESTNGTYINERRLNPGFPIPVDPGSFLIFGDIHLAMFRVRKMMVEAPRETDAAAKQETQTEVVVSAAAAEDITTS